jgi:hypothetical protein
MQIERSENWWHPSNSADTCASQTLYQIQFIGKWSHWVRPLFVRLDSFESDFGSPSNPVSFQHTEGVTFVCEVWYSILMESLDSFFIVFKNQNQKRKLNWSESGWLNSVLLLRIPVNQDGVNVDYVAYPGSAGNSVTSMFSINKQMHHYTFTLGLWCIVNDLFLPIAIERKPITVFSKESGQTLCVNCVVCLSRRRLETLAASGHDAA